MTEESEPQTQSRRAGDTLRAAFVCLLVLLFSVTAQQFSTRANLLLPQQAEQESTSEEIQEGKIKALELVAASRRKAFNQSLRALISARNRSVLRRVEERRSAIALCWSLHLYSRRGPPHSAPLS